MDLVNEGMDYGQLSEAVRQYSAQRLFSLIEVLQPHVDNLFDRDPNAMGYMEPVRITAQAGVARLFVASVKELGDLYRVGQEPRPVEPPEPMVPAAQVPLMIEAAVGEAVQEAVAAVRMELESQAAERREVAASEARAAVVTALARIRERS